jgi:sorting nexin-1/2
VVPSVKGRGARGQKRIVTTQATKLENVDDPMGALGPLGDSFTSQAGESPLPSPLPQGLQPQIQRPTASSNASLKTLMGSVRIDDDDDQPGPSGLRSPPPVQPSAGAGASQRQREPHVNVVEAAKATSFNITVGDPHKVGDLTSAHTEYQVYTKVSDVLRREVVMLINGRPHPKHTASQNSLFLAVFEIFSGSIISCTTTFRAQSFLHLRRNKQLGASMLISWKQEDKHWSEC